MKGTTPDGTCYQVQGSMDGPALVLIHGIGLSLHIWDEYVPAFSERYRVIRYDLYGHGSSTRPEQKLTLSEFSAQLEDLMDHFEISSSHLIGFSLGGMINRRFAMDHPARVESLVVMNSPHERTPEQQKLVEDRAEQTDEGGAKATVETSLMRWFTPAFIAEEPESIARYRKQILGNDPKTFSESRKVLAKGVLELISPNPPISCPTLVLSCEHDSGSTPTMTIGIASEIPNSEIHIVPNLQHLGMIEQPPLFLSPILGFLESHSN